MTEVSTGFDPSSARFGLAGGFDVVLAGPLSGLVEGTGAQLGVWWGLVDRYVAANRSGAGISWGGLPSVHAEAMDQLTRTVVVPELVGSRLPPTSAADPTTWSCSRTACTISVAPRRRRPGPAGSLPGGERLRGIATVAGFGRVGRLDVAAPMNIVLELRR